jgi:hypothetical protein
MCTHIYIRAHPHTHTHTHTHTHPHTLSLSLSLSIDLSRKQHTTLPTSLSKCTNSRLKFSRTTAGSCCPKSLRNTLMFLHRVLSCGEDEEPAELSWRPNSLQEGTHTHTHTLAYENIHTTAQHSQKRQQSTPTNSTPPPHPPPSLLLPKPTERSQQPTDDRTVPTRYRRTAPPSAPECVCDV